MSAGAAELAHHPILVSELIAGMERGQLHRDAVASGDVLIRAGGFADRDDSRAILLEILLRILGRQRGLAQHVEGVAIRALARAAGSLSASSMSRPITN